MKLYDTGEKWKELVEFNGLAIIKTDKDQRSLSFQNQRWPSRRRKAFKKKAKLKSLGKARVSHKLWNKGR